MWFPLGFQNFIAKKSLNNNICDVFVSDFIHIWHKTLSNNELISISQALNPLLEASVQKLRDVTLNCLEDARTQKEINVEDNMITLKLESNTLGMKFRFQISLNEGNSEMFFNEITFPLLIMLKNTQHRENKLISIVEDKDKEIAEYRRECGELKSRFIVTKPFIKDEFSKNEGNVDSWDLSAVLDCMKHLSKEKFCKTEQAPSAIGEEEEKCPRTNNKCDTKQSISMHKSITKRIGSKPCVSLDNQTVNKRRKSTLKLHF